MMIISKQGRKKKERNIGVSAHRVTTPLGADGGTHETSTAVALTASREGCSCPVGGASSVRLEHPAADAEQPAIKLRETNKSVSHHIMQGSHLAQVFAH
jgi:hypothetical protein